MKRIVCLLLSLCLCMSVCVFPASAADETLTVESVTAKPGETAELKVSISGGAEIAGLVLTVNADERLELRTAVNGSALKGFSSGKNLVWVPETPTAAEGTLAVLTVFVPETLPAGTYPVEIVVRECLDSDMNDLPLKGASGAVRVEGAAAEEGPAPGNKPTEALPVQTVPFTDVSAEDYYYEAVLWAAEKNISSGTDERHFSPYLSCTRAQTVTFLWRAAGSPEPEAKTCRFEDVDTGAYYGKAVLWAVENGVTNGISETAFSPETTVTRAQAVTFLYRSASAQPVSAENPFADVAEDSVYRDAILWAYAGGITSGTAADRFSPDEVCMRCQIAAFLYRFFSA